MEGESTGFSQELLSDAGTFVEEIKPKLDNDPGWTSNTAASLTTRQRSCRGPLGNNFVLDLS